MLLRCNFANCTTTFAWRYASYKSAIIFIGGGASQALYLHSHSYRQIKCGCAVNRHQKNIALLKVTVLYTVGLINTVVYRPAVLLIFNKLSSWHNLFHFAHSVLRHGIYDMRCPNPPSWWRSPAVEHRSLADVLSLSCVRLVADGWPLMWVSHPL